MLIGYQCRWNDQGRKHDDIKEEGWNPLHIVAAGLGVE